MTQNKPIKRIKDKMKDYANEEKEEKKRAQRNPIKSIKDKINDYFSEKKSKKKKLNERIKEVAGELAEIFEHRELREATDKNRYQVIGFIKDMYLDHEILLKNETKKTILDLACYYSRIKREPAVYSIVPDIILKNYVQTNIILPSPVEFDNFPGEKFSEIGILAPKYLPAALHIINDYKEKLNGYPTRVKMGLCNLFLIGRSRHNRFLAVLRDAPGTYELQYNAVLAATEIDESIKEDQRILINRLKGDKNLLDDQVDEAYQTAEIYKSAYIVRTKDIQAERQHNIEDEFRKRLKEKRFIKRQKSFDWTAMIIIIAFIALIGLILWFFISGPLATPKPPSETLSTANSLLKFMYRGMI